MKHCGSGSGGFGSVSLGFVDRGCLPRVAILFMASSVDLTSVFSFAMDGGS